MKFERLHTLILEAGLPFREFEKIPDLINLNITKIIRFFENIKKVKEQLQQHEDWEDINYYLRQFDEDYLYEYYSRRFSNDASSYDSLSGIGQDAIRVKNNALNPDNGWKYSDLVRYYSEVCRRILAINEDLESHPWVTKKFEQVKELLDQLENRGYDDSSLFHDYLALFLQIPKRTEEFFRIIQRYEQGISVQMKRIYNRQGDYTKPDDLNSVEIAYHASINAKPIAENGFTPETDKTDSSEGIGGSNIKNGISFTLDLYHAKNIARVLKTAWMIANKKLSFESIKEFIKKHPRPGYDLNSVIQQYQNDSKENEYPIKNEYQLFKFYEKSLWFTDTYNPVFFGLDRKKFVDILKGVPYENIGVIQCKVNTTAPHVEYIASMEELRIKPEDVVSVDKFIR